MKINSVYALLVGSFVACSTSGCLLAAAGVGAEAAYVGTQSDRSALETLEDQRLTAAIKSKMLADMDVSGLDINVDTFKSNVTLRGVVKTQHELDRAVEIARSTDGVKDVTSRLFVDAN